MWNFDSSPDKVSEEKAAVEKQIESDKKDGAQTPEDYIPISPLVQKNFGLPGGTLI